MADPVRGPDGVWYSSGPSSVPFPARRGFGGWARWLGRRMVSMVAAVARFGKRAVTSLPWVGGRAWSSNYGTERALGLIPLFASVRILADMVASLPVQVYRRNGGERIPQTFLPDLLFRPGARDDLFGWLHKLVWSLCLRGNAYGLIVNRDSMGFPTQVEWLFPDDVWVDEQMPTQPIYFYMGQRVPTEDIVHIGWVVPAGKVVGLSPIQAFAKTIGVGLSATEYGLRWFDNGGVPPWTLKNLGKTLTPDEAEDTSDRLAARLRSGKPLVYGNDWDFEAIAVNPEEAQFLQTIKANATLIAAIFGVPPEMVGGETGGSHTYSSPEANTNQLITLTLRPWTVRIENRLSALLPSSLYAKFNLDAMIRVDTLARYQAHHIALEDGWKTRDEIRALEDLSPMSDTEAKPSPRDIAEMMQKVYLAVGKMVTVDEARELLNSAGATLSIPGPTFPPAGPQRTPPNPAEPDDPARHLPYPGRVNGHRDKEIANV